MIWRMRWNWWWPMRIVVVLLGVGSLRRRRRRERRWRWCCWCNTAANGRRVTDRIRAAHAERLTAVLVEEAARVVVAEDPGLPDRQIG